MNVFNLSDILGEAAAGRRDPPDILPEAAIERLREAFPRYTGPCPFKPGDLVTPRRDSTVKSDHVGKPYLVIDVPSEPKNPTIDGATVGTPQAGWRLDMRTLFVFEDHLVPMWQDSAEFEPYIGPGCSQ